MRQEKNYFFLFNYKKEYKKLISSQNDKTHTNSNMKFKFKNENFCRTIYLFQFSYYSASEMIKMRSNSLRIVILFSLIGIISSDKLNESGSDSEAPSPSRPIQIAHPVDHKFRFELDDLKRILEADNIKDRQVVIVSVTGAFRKGKSFLLNFFLRFLYARYEKHDVSDWIGEDNSTELSGFLWRGGRKPATTGIVMWSDIFTHDYENGDRVAIILLDTQGTFDSRTTLLESTIVFALSTLLASVQCFNVMQNIQEDDLQHLQLFVEYARLASEQSDEKPFQNLLFIVRDWPNQLEVDYGWNGQQVLDEVLAEHISNGRYAYTTKTNSVEFR